MNLVFTILSRMVFNETKGTLNFFFYFINKKNDKLLVI